VKARRREGKRQKSKGKRQKYASIMTPAIVSVMKYGAKSASSFLPFGFCLLPFALRRSRPPFYE